MIIQEYKITQRALKKNGGKQLSRGQMAHLYEIISMALMVPDELLDTRRNGLIETRYDKCETQDCVESGRCYGRLEEELVGYCHTCNEKMVRGRALPLLR